MTGGSRIIAFGGPEEHVEPLQDAESGAADDVLLLAEESEEDISWAEDYDEQDVERPSIVPKLITGLAITAIVAWTAFFCWAHWGDFASGSSASAWVGYIVNWSVPLVLVAGLWLLGMRNSKTEARRFGEIARMLSNESALLETRLLTVNRELSLAREFIASQSRDLESLGRMASERISTHAAELQDLVAQNNDRVNQIGTVSETARENMEKLREQLPVIASSAKDVTNNIGNAGRTAHAQIEEMVLGFKRINEFGKASESQVQHVRDLFSDVIDGLSQKCEALETFARERFAEFDKQGGDMHARLEEQEVEVLAAIRTRASTLTEELENTRLQLTQQEDQSLGALQTRISTLRDEGGTISAAMREGEEGAAQSWRVAMERLEQDRSAFFAKVDEADRAAVDRAERRLSAVIERTTAIEDELAARDNSLNEALAERRKTAEAAEQSAIERLAGQLAEFDTEIDKRRSEHEDRGAALANRASAVLVSLAKSEEHLARIAGEAESSEQKVGESLQALTENLSSARSGISETKSELETLTEDSFRVLELIQGAVAHSKERIPEAIQEAEASLAALETRVGSVRETVENAAASGNALFSQVNASDTALKSLLVQIEERQSALQRGGADHRETLSALSRALETLEEQSDKVSNRAKTELTSAISKLELAAGEAVASIETKGAKGIAALADQLGEASADAIERAVRTRAAEAAIQLEKAAAEAAGVSRSATIQLKEQLSMVDELVGNLEQRVTHARDMANEQVDNDFARRVALITESLNSNSIDIAKALSTEVTDTSWEGYLRGDRGIFTRRAVILLDSAEAKAIQQIFERDSDFREHVSRYIHDFEGILREVLSTRNGNALGVTLLSSDMGKLYVALAQAIDRLRK